MTAVPPPFNIVTKYTATSLDDGTKYYLNFPFNYNIVSDTEKDKHSTTFKPINIETKARYLFQTRHPEGLNGYLVLNPDEPVDKWVSTFVEINDDDDDEDEDYWVCDCGDCEFAKNNLQCQPVNIQFEIVDTFEEEPEDFDYDVKSDCSDDSDYEFDDDYDDEDDNDYDVEESDDEDVEEPEDYEDGYPIVYVDEDESELHKLITDYEEKSKYNFIRTERTLRNKTYTSTIKQKI